MIFDILRWLVALELIGLATAPIGARVFPTWPDRGFGFSKILGLVLVGHFLWFTGMLGITPFTGPAIVVVTAALAFVAWRGSGWQLLRGNHATRRLWITEEALFLVVFLVGCAVRSASPAIAGQEKQMDLTFLHSLIQATTLPATDAWLAGFGLPYYYFGYLLQALIPKAMAIEPAVAYNLGMVTVWSLGALGAFTLVTNLLTMPGARMGDAPLSAPIRPTQAAFWGILAAFMLTVMGNLQALAEVLLNRGIGDHAFWTGFGIKNLSALPVDAWFPTDGGWWFRAARVIPNIEPDGITEFPYFSFLLGDLHPHFMALPLALLVLGLAANHLWPPPPEAQGTDWVGRASRLWVPAVVLGIIIPANTWEVPLLWGTYSAGSFVGARVQGQPLGASLRTAVAHSLGILILGALLVAPYFVAYVSQPLGLGIVTTRTPLGSLFILFGPLLVLPIVAGLCLLLREGWRGAPRPAFVILGISLVVFAALALLREPTLGILLGLAVTWGAILRQRIADHEGPASIMLPAFVIIGLLAVLTPEVVFLSDVFRTRMNTVFKFYYDAWILLALAAPLAARELFGLVREAMGPAFVRLAAAGGVATAAALVAAGALYPLGATPARTQSFITSPTLDGMAHLRQFQPDDAAAIDWLRREHPGAGVVEAVGDDYTDAGRFSTFGGTRAPLGWIGHELQWRGPNPEIEARRTLVRRVYTEPLDDATRRALRQMNMEFIAVGSMERQIYGPDVTTRFEGLETAHRSGATVVYRLRRLV